MEELLHLPRLRDGLAQEDERLARLLAPNEVAVGGERADGGSADDEHRAGSRQGFGS